MNTSTSSTQGTEDTPESVFEVLMQGITLAIIALLSILFNLVGCYIILKNPSFRNKPHFKLLLALSVSDLTLALTCMPLSVSSVFLGSNVLWTSRPFCMFNGFISSSMVAASTFGLTAISLDRYFAILSPLKYRDFILTKKINIIIIVIWVISLMSASPPLFGWPGFAYNPGTHHCSPQWNTGCGFYTLAVVAGLVIPIAIMATSYFFIYRKLKHNHGKVTPGMVRVNHRPNPPEPSQCPETSVSNMVLVDVDNEKPSCHGSANGDNVSHSGSEGRCRKTNTGRGMSNQVKGRISLRAEKKVAITGAILILIYFLCWLPYATVNSCFLHRIRFHRYIRVTAMWLVYSNSVCNPIIYTWTNQQVREKIIDLLRKVSCRQK